MRLFVLVLLCVRVTPKSYEAIYNIQILPLPYYVSLFSVDSFDGPGRGA